MHQKRNIQYDPDFHLCYVPLTKGHWAVIDPADAPEVSKYNWHYLRGYAVTTKWNKIKGYSETLFLHRIINKTPPGMFTDHINHNTLDDRRCNLRSCTKQENQCNMKKHTRNSSGLKGVHLHKKTQKWRSCIMHKGISYHLGLFKTPEEAHEAYKKAAKELHGEFYHY